MRMAIAALAVCMMGTTASAQQVLARYNTWIGLGDYYNSSGARLSGVCTVLRQDRANYHRFGRSDRGDESDPYFGRQANRAVFGGNCGPAAEWNGDWVEDQVRAGVAVWVHVMIIGSGGRVTAVRYHEGAG